MDNLIETLHRVSTKLSEITEEIQIYEIMYEGIKDILPDVYFIITKLQPDNINFRITHSFGVDKYIPAVKTLFGKDPFQMDFSYSDLSEFKQNEYETRKLYHFSNGIYDLANGRFSKTICRAFEKILGISDVYAISLLIKNIYFGGAIFFIPNSYKNSGNLSQDKILAIETIAAQVSLVINKLRDIESLKRKDQELSISQSKFNQLVNQLNDVVWKANGDGTQLIDLNNSFETFYGCPLSKFKNNPNLLYDIIHPEDREIFKNATIDLLNNGKTQCEYRVKNPDGSLKWVNDRRSIVYDANGKPIQMGGVASDITEKKLLEEQLQLKNYALDNSPNAIGMYNLQGEVIYVNDSFAKLWACSDKNTLIGKHYSGFSIYGKPSMESFEAILKGEVFIGEDESIRKDGTTFNYIISARLVKQQQKPLCIMAVFTDITERKQQENIRRENEANLLKLNNDKDKFFSIISHDLRSPFSGMLPLLEVLVNNYFDYSDEERLKIIQASHNSAVKAYNLLTDLLEWARIQNNKVEIVKETIMLQDVLDENITLFKGNAENKNISIRNNIDQNTQVTVDVNSLTTIVRNLLINAIKFTHPGGNVEFGSKQLHNAIEFSIKDTGVGMTEDTIDRLFRLDENITMPGTNNEKGTGLGLTICNDLIALNGWKMHIESQPGHGTTFRVLIPQ